MKWTLDTITNAPDLNANNLMLENNKFLIINWHLILKMHVVLWHKYNFNHMYPKTRKNENFSNKLAQAIYVRIKKNTRNKLWQQMMEM